jgi:hypothetical protein
MMDQQNEARLRELYRQRENAPPDLVKVLAPIDAEIAQLEAQLQDEPAPTSLVLPVVAMSPPVGPAPPFIPGWFFRALVITAAPLVVLLLLGQRGGGMQPSPSAAGADGTSGPLDVNPSQSLEIKEWLPL